MASPANLLHEMYAKNSVPFGLAAVGLLQTLLLSSLLGFWTLVRVIEGAVLLWALYKFYEFYSAPPVQTISVKLGAFEANDTIDAPVLEKLEIRDESKPGKIVCFDPATAQHLGDVHAMDQAAVDAVILKASLAQPAWAETSFAQRKAVMSTLLRYFVEQPEAICRVSSRDTGKTTLGAMLGEIVPTCEKLRWILRHGEGILATETRGGHGLLTMHKVARVEYHPVGVLGVIAPWNYPCHNFMNHVISGLFSGNAVVCKVSEYTSWSADFFLRIVRAALVACGHSPELVQVVTGFGEAGAALVGSNRINKIIFTGSDAVGRHVMRGAASNLTPVVLELGGKDPMVICEDADLSHVVPIAMRGVFQNCGQNCIGVERLFVHEALHDEFIDKMHAIVRQLKQGPPLAGDGSGRDMGAMVMPSQLDLIQALVDDAVAKGAKLHFGGKRMPNSPGLFYEPTILTGITNDMRIAQEEVFGPVMAVAIWKDESDLLARVNDNKFGLGSSVFTKDRARALRISKGIQAGQCNINDFGVNYLCQSLPFGGVKHSGFGRFAGPEGLRACCYTKSVTEDRLSLIQTTIPPPMAYPTQACGTDMASSLVSLAFGGIAAKCKGIYGLVKAVK